MGVTSDLVFGEMNNYDCCDIHAREGSFHDDRVVLLSHRRIVEGSTSIGTAKSVSFRF